MAAAIHPAEGIFNVEEVRIIASPLTKKLRDLADVGLFRGNHKLDEESKLRWLASEIIGGEAEMVSPFRRRRITYYDHTASGRFLLFIEDYLMTDVLPFYGLSSSSSSSSQRHRGPHRHSQGREIASPLWSLRVFRLRMQVKN